MSIQHVSPQSPLRIKASDWNTIADAINYGAPVKCVDPRNPRSTNGVIINGWCHDEAHQGMAVGWDPVITQSIAENYCERTGNTGHVTVSNYFPDPLYSREAYTKHFGISLGTGNYFPICYAGLCYAQVNMQSLDDTYVYPYTDGDLSSTKYRTQAAILGVGPQTSEVFTNKRWCLILLRNDIQEYNATAGTFVIDRTLAADDNKCWEPAANLPEGWATFGSVELRTPGLRVTPGTDGTFVFEQVVTCRTWDRDTAPIISTGGSTAISTTEFTCEE